MPKEKVNASIKNDEFRKRVADFHSQEAVEGVEKTIEGVAGIPEQAWREEILPLMEKLSEARNDVEEFLKILLLIEARIRDSREFWETINRGENGGNVKLN